MLEKIVTSKTRIKILKLFLTNIDARYYLRELERILDESLSPLRRQLIKLVKMGILITQEEGNVKYYLLNKNFTGIDELRNLVLDKKPAAEIPTVITPAYQTVETPPVVNEPVAVKPKPKNEIRFLSAIFIFFLIAVALLFYTNSKNVKEVKEMISVSEKSSQIKNTVSSSRTSNPDEMISRRWKLIPGNNSAILEGGD